MQKNIINWNDSSDDIEIFCCLIMSNGPITWELSFRPNEAGDYMIIIDIKSNDPDHNQIEEAKNFPFSIKL